MLSVSAKKRYLSISFRPPRLASSSSILPRDIHDEGKDADADEGAEEPPPPGALGPAARRGRGRVGVGLHGCVLQNSPSLARSNLGGLGGLLSHLHLTLPVVVVFPQAGPAERDVVEGVVVEADDAVVVVVVLVVVVVVEERRRDQRGNLLLHQVADLVADGIAGRAGRGDEPFLGCKFDYGNISDVDMYNIKNNFTYDFALLNASLSWQPFEKDGSMKRHSIHLICDYYHSLITNQGSHDKPLLSQHLLIIITSLR